MRRPINPYGDEYWPEVRYINSYALFMAYLSMAVRGVGFLVLTWTTVVLLGGFVSMLDKYDFWALTVITLLQTAGIFDVFLNEKLRYIKKSFRGLVLGSTLALVGTQRNNCQLASIIARLVIGYSIVLAQLLLLVFILCPLAAIYVIGLPISSVISMWRLIKHDYGNLKGKDNLKPALLVLYSLALLQGVLFSYKFIFAFTEKRIVRKVAKDYTFKANTHSLVLKYLRETRTGCEKDPSFAKGRNSITYAVDLMGSSLPNDYLHGVMILGALTEVQQGLSKRSSKFNWQEMLMNTQIVSGSFGLILQRLLYTLDPRSQYDPATREHAARVVTYLAWDISLEQFPLALKHICCLLNWSDLQSLFAPGLRILENLGNNKENCRIMINTDGLLSKITRPVSSDVLHQVDHDRWSDTVDASLKVMLSWLATASKEDADKLRRYISSNEKAISGMEYILSCRGEGKDECHVGRRIQAMKILIQLDRIDRRIFFLQHLLGIFLGEILVCSPASEVRIEGNTPHISTDNSTQDYKNAIRESAGENLGLLCLKSRDDALVIIPRDHRVFNVMAIRDILLNDKSEKCSIISAGILEGICHHFNDHDQFLLNDVVPKTLRQLLNLPAADIEGQQAGVVRSLSERLEVAMWSFCMVVCKKSQQDLAPTFRAIYPESDSFSFPRRLKGLVEVVGYSDYRLRVLKLAAEMAILMIKGRNNYRKEDLDGLVTSLYEAWDNNHFKDIDGMMLLSEGDGVATLGSLVKEAEQLNNTNTAPSTSASVES